MRAFTLNSFEALPGLREDLPTPQVGPDQLLVRVQASSVNPIDAFIAAGFLKDMVLMSSRSCWAATSPAWSSRSAPTSSGSPPATGSSAPCRRWARRSTTAPGPS